MPQLPSGMHVGVDIAPLWTRLNGATYKVIMATMDPIQTPKDLAPWVRYVELVPAAPGTPALTIAPGSGTPPPGLTARDLGRRLADFPQGLPEWDATDRAAFARFAQERMQGYLTMQFEEVSKWYQQRMVQMMERIESAWMAAGVHPSQEPGWDDWPDTQSVDVFDRLVAVMQCEIAIRHAPAGQVQVGAGVDRLNAFVFLARQKLPWLPMEVSPTKPTAEIAARLRRSAPKAGPLTWNKAWWEAQTREECSSLFDVAELEPLLLREAPKAYGVVRLVAISHVRGATGSPLAKKAGGPARTP